MNIGRCIIASTGILAFTFLIANDMVVAAFIVGWAAWCIAVSE